MLAEHNFEEPLSDELLTAVRGYALGFGASIVNENAFNRLRSVASNHASNVMGRHSRWGNLSESTLLEDVGFQQVKVGAVARTQGREPVQASAFVRSSEEEFSLGQAQLQSLSGSDHSWSHPSPLKDKLSTMSWKAWKVCEHDVDKFKLVWQSLLALPGCCISCQARSVFGLVMASTSWGLWFMPCLPQRSANGELYLVLKRGAVPTYLVITDHRDFKLGRPRLLTPRASSQLVESRSCRMIWKWERSEGENLAVAAAKEGFKNLTKYFLDKFVKHEQLSFPRGQTPTLVADIVGALYRHFRPEVTEAEVQAAVALRGTPSKVERELADRSHLCQASNAELLETSLDDDDALELRATVTRAKKVRKQAVAVPPRSEPQGWTRKQVDPAISNNLVEARKLLPPQKGCTLTVDQTRFTRWCGAYPREVQPTHVSKAYGPRTGLSSLVVCASPGVGLASGCDW